MDKRSRNGGTVFGYWIASIGVGLIVLPILMGFVVWLEDEKKDARNRLQ
jgi:hypothetical protein